ncbi:ATP-binding protein [Isoptericola sp. BMS4]|uniref:sensor histidine kinase n=1 Tax=Isoptericola sp. BMS4 TaxID=2527875 RepID=UPI001423B0FB|nr:ATP-binding protein [Isoptericola sp. BMS4]
MRDTVRRVLLVVGAVLLLALCMALVAVERALSLLQDDAPDGAIASARLWNELLLVVVLVLVALVVVVGTLGWRALHRRVTDPLERLAVSVREASTGAHEREVRVESLGAGTGPVAAEVVALATDVEQMRRELVQQVAEVRESHEETEHARAQLAAQARELARSNRDLEQFAYVASHDLQEPLRKVASFTQLLQKRYGDQLDDRADQYIAFAVDGARRMQRLIQDLLSFSRVGRSGGPVTDVDLAAVLTQVLHDLDARVVETGARVTHGPLPVVRGERGLLAMLLANVVGNALKFRDPDRPPRVHVAARRVTAAEAAAEAPDDRRDGPDWWELSCTDNGIGIDPQYAERVFVIFQRLHPKEVYSGTGIGLALVKRVVEHHGGRVWLEPAEHDGVREGTVVRWTLPAGGTAPGDDVG